MARESCLYCVRKHIAQAAILMDEAELGYPHHRWFAAGHLAEAESESRKEYPEFSKTIREARLSIMHPDRRNDEPSFDTLMLMACRLAGEDDEQHEGNSKTF